MTFNPPTQKKILIILIVAVLAVSFYFIFPSIARVKYSGADQQSDKTEKSMEAVVPPIVVPPVPPPITHIATPKQVKAVYMSSWVAGAKSYRDKVMKTIDETEVNAVVIDVKDSTGRISFAVYDPKLQAEGSVERRIADLPGLIAELHGKGIYVIGRIAVFQDPYFVKKHPDLGVKKASDKNALWGDRKGVHWLDAGSKDVWEYTMAIAHEAYAQGFDELNFDYIRFPSDGNMKDIYYPISEGKIKRDVINSFFEYVHAHLGTDGEKTSADLFGMTTTNSDDLGIGQVLENALRNFDYVAPMVYPSHYPPGWNGYKNPATKPYEVIHASMSGAVAKAKAMAVDPLKLRPWLQDFNLGATYTPEMVRAQIKATYDIGLDSWMLWDPANTYTGSALEKN